MFKIKQKRSHDDFYLNEKFIIKEYYKFIIKRLNKNLNGKKVLDIGCATGDFLKFINIKFPKSKRYGLEINKKLCSIAQKRKIAEKIFNKNILKIKKFEKFDFIFISGVHSIFDDLFLLFSKLKMLMSSKNSEIYVFGIWNPYDVDVLVRLKKKKYKYWEKGWNVFSLNSAKELILKLNLNYKIYKFSLNKKIKKNSNDLFRSWSFLYQKNKNIIINGSNIIHNFYLIKIYKKK